MLQHTPFLPEHWLRLSRQYVARVTKWKSKRIIKEEDAYALWGAFVGELRAISAKIPEEVYKEMLLRVPEGGRSDFVRDAILEKLQKTPKPDKILEIEQRLNQMWKEFSEIKKYLSDLELLTYDRGKVNPHTFCVDELDHKLMDFLTHYRGATTPELAEYLKTNRWMVLNRLRRIQKASGKQVGKSVIDYYAGERSGKKKAWWVNEELVETPT